MKRAVTAEVEAKKLMRNVGDLEAGKASTQEVL